MKIIEPSFEITQVTDPELANCARMARLCYGRDLPSNPQADQSLIRAALDKRPVPHDSLTEHASMSVIVVTSRAIGNQFTRHRKAVYSQESTRWINYDKRLGGAGAPVIKPLAIAENEAAGNLWENTVEFSLLAYGGLIKLGIKPEAARGVLPLDLATTIGCTATYTAWRRFFTMRCDRHADPEIRRWAEPLLKEARNRVPVVFDDCGLLA